MSGIKKLGKSYTHTYSRHYMGVLNPPSFGITYIKIHLREWFLN